MRGTAEYRLAEELVMTQRALESANKTLHEHGLIGSIPSFTPTERGASAFHSKVRKKIKEAQR